MTPLTALTAWIFALLLLLSPPERRAEYQAHTTRPIPLEQRETTAEGRARYQSIASDLAAVLSDPSTQLPYVGRLAKERSAALVLAVAVFEGGFRKDVDLGEGPLARGDHGRSFCLMQIQTGTGTVPAKDPVVASWTGKDLVTDRTKCFRAGIAMIRQSLSACRDLASPRDRLSAYTTGTCRDEEQSSRGRVGMADRIFSMLPRPERTKEPTPATSSLPTGAGSPVHAAP